MRSICASTQGTRGEIVYIEDKPAATLKGKYFLAYIARELFEYILLSSIILPYLVWFQLQSSWWPIRLPGYLGYDTRMPGVVQVGPPKPATGVS